MSWRIARRHGWTSRRRHRRPGPRDWYAPDAPIGRPKHDQGAHSMQAERLHWLVDVVRAAGLHGSEHLVIGERTAAPEAWALAAGSCRVSQDELAAWVAEHFHLPVAD